MKTIQRIRSQIPAPASDLSWLRDSRGATLIIALIVMGVLSILTIGSLQMLTANIQISNNHIKDMQALYIADAGIEDAIDRLRDDPNWDAGLTDVEFPPGSGNTYTVTIDNSGYPSVIITSTGKVSDFQRTLEAQIDISGSSAPYSVTTVYWKEL